jgi:guanylate kinase
LKTKRKLVFVISGPSGSGKTTLVRGVLSDAFLRRRLARSVSYTTRAKRSKEKSGKDYLFINETSFRYKLKGKKLLEWTKYLGYYYGTPIFKLEEKLRKKQGMVLCLDVRGALRVRKLYPKNSVLIFVLPPSLRHLPDRIQRRCNRTGSEEIKQRIQLASKEIRASRYYDYRIVNKDLEKAVRRLQDIIKQEIKK